MFNPTISTTDKYLTVVNDNQYDIKNGLFVNFNVLSRIVNPTVMNTMIWDTSKLKLKIAAE